MTYDFDQIVDRKKSGSYKWDGIGDAVPMWVADMDYKTAPAIIEALERRASHGIFGYQVVTEEWYQAIQDWWKVRHGLTIEKDWLVFCTGVVPAITCAVKRLTNHGDRVLVQTPVYDIFFHSIENMGRHVIENELRYDGQSYDIDYEDLEQKLKDPLTTLMILCNPHNPAGRIWTKEQLAKIGSLCKKHHVLVISDEIHCELTDPGYSYVPFASASEECASISVTAISASKTFNIAGLQSAAVFIPEEGIREKMVRGLNSDEIAEPNAFAIDAVVAAYTQGAEWLEELKQYLYENKCYIREYIKKELPQLKIVKSEATYLLWIDCSDLLKQLQQKEWNAPDRQQLADSRWTDTVELQKYLKDQAGVYLSGGKQYRGNGDKFLRMNVACPRSQVEEGLRRLRDGITSLLGK